mgnify:CR=1 FL=1
MNPELHELYKKNILSVMNQVYFDRKHSVDWVIFINGIPIITIELKNSLTKNEPIKPLPPITRIFIFIFK